MSDRLHTAARLYAFAVLGLFLLLVPWTAAWDQATFLLPPGGLEGMLRSGWVRGVVSGLGALDLLVAAGEAGRLWRQLRREGHGR